MMFSAPRILQALVLFAVAAVCSGATAPGRIKIVLVGDSTVTDSAGWGGGFSRLVDPERAEVINTSQGGRSSMSFIKEGRWERALALKADYYLIQFGHNDEPGKPGRSTTLEEYRRYMEQYVDEARASGAIPVLVTSLVRRQFDKNDDHRINSSLESHVAIVKEIAAAKHVPLVDLHARSKALCEKLGREACHTFSPTKTVDGKSAYDGTHLNAEGHVMFAELVVDELRHGVPALAPIFLAKAVDAAQPRVQADAIVSADGSGTHTTVQAAVDAAPSQAGKPFVIQIKPGVYHEHVVIPEDKPRIRLVGDRGETENTVISMGTNVGSVDANGSKLSTPDSATVLVRADDFTAENITFENTTTREQRIQALAFYITGDRAILRHCRFLGWQDTLRADSPRDRIARQYFVDCAIEGHVDFIYAAGTAVFDRCHIHCRGDGYITAASTPANAPFGYVFLDCRVTAAPGVQTYLGRPWRPYASVTFVRCELPAEVVPAGWHNWGKASNEQTARFAEYKSSGPGARPADRVPWSHALTDAEAERITVGNVLAGSDGWKP